MPGIIAALRLLVVPLYCASLLAPSAMLLCWGSALFSVRALHAAASSPRAAAALKLPSVLVRPPAPPAVQAAAPGTSAADAGAEAGSSGMRSEVGGSAARTRAPVDAASSSAPPHVPPEAALSAAAGDAELLSHLGSRFMSRARKGDAVLAEHCFRVALGLKANCLDAQAGLTSSGGGGSTQAGAAR